VADMAELQNYNLSIPARRIVPLLSDLKFSGASATAQEKLLHWNFLLDQDSVEAGIYEMFQRRLIANVREIFVPKAAQHLIYPPMTRIIGWLYAPDGRFGADPLAGRDAVLVKSLDEAVAELTKRFGTDMNGWKLGAFHYATIPHPLSHTFDVGHAPRGGDTYTINSTGGEDNQTAGGSLKLIIDTADWDNSIAQNNPGQSGDVNSPHYKDLYPIWAAGKYFPILFSREHIESVTEKTEHLTPF
jgi:penicillin amidase